jgi:hypothetical protein
MTDDVPDGFFRLKISTNAMLEAAEPDDDLVKYRVDLVELDEDGEDLDPVGHFDAWRFNIAAYINREAGPLFDLFDADSQEAADLHGILFDSETGDWKQSLFGGPPIGGIDLFYFQWAEFPPKLKRSRLVLMAAERTIQLLAGGCCLAALWPWDNPHPDTRDLSPDELLQFFERQKDNEDYWGKLGFRRFENSSVLTRDLTLRPPSLGGAEEHGEADWNAN